MTFARGPNDSAAFGRRLWVPRDQNSIASPLSSVFALGCLPRIRSAWDRQDGKRTGRTYRRNRVPEPASLTSGKGMSSVLDRPRLEQMCCECYAVVKKETDRLLPQPHDPSGFETARDAGDIAVGAPE